MHSGDFERTKYITAEMLLHLQHRGPDGAGVAVTGSETPDDNPVYSDLGSVKDVLTPSNLSGLGRGEYSIGHVRYRTKGSLGRVARLALQPFRNDSRSGHPFWIAHNGQFSGSLEGYPSDTSKFANDVAHRMVGRVSLTTAVVRELEVRHGSAYSLLIMDKNGVLAVRDPFGLHPLFYGYSEHLDSHLVASETPALTNLGVHDLESLPPGHILKLQQGQEPLIEPFVERPERPQICAMEIIYFVRADGKLEHKDIYVMRKDAGRYLGWLDRRLDADAVMPTPDSARAAAQGYAEVTGIPYEEAMIKTTSDRSFLQSTQAERERVANHKLQIIPSQVEGRRIVLVEDSIVRGTTLIDLVKRLKKFGAKEVHLRIAAPPLTDTCDYGIDIATRRELIAFQKKGDIEAIRRELYADSLRYIELEDLKKSMGPELGERACTKCFNSVRPSGDFIYKLPFKKSRSRQKAALPV